MAGIGPAYWVQHLAPPKYSQFLGYLVGWLTVAAWWFITVANNLYISQITLAVAEALNPGYTAKDWHSYLLYCAFMLVIFLVNLPRVFKILPSLLIAAMVLINFTALYLLISLLVRATPKQSAHDVFVEVVNYSGWESNGVVFFLALLPGVLTVSGFDSVTHITDEVENPTKQVPQVMIGSACLSAIAAFAMAIVYAFCTVNTENLLDPYNHQPVIQMIFDSSRSTAIATVSCVLLIGSVYCASVAAFTSWNRLYWSFAREGGLPFPKAMAKLSSSDALPVNALITNLVMVLALGVIQVGSLTALNGILGGSVVCIIGSFALTLGLALWRGRDFLSQSRWLNLGRWGTPLQVVALVWCVFISIWLCFPLYLPVTVEYMNWTSVVFTGTIALAVAYWVLFRAHIKPVELERHSTVL